MENKTDPIARFVEHFSSSLSDESFISLALSGPIRPGEGPDRVLGRLIDLRKIPHLSLTLRYAKKDETRNLTLAEAPGWLGSQLGTAFRSAWLATTKRDWQFAISPKGAVRLQGHHAAARRQPARTHDQPRASFLDPTAQDWLHALDVTDASGRVRAAMAGKHRQIHHYLEILSHLARDCGWSPESPDKRELVIADMGCGKGYLTFGAWHLFHRRWKWPVKIIGVETRPELASAANQIAQKLGMTGLEFTPGDIQSVKLPRLDALIALHACNTATDDAIRRGVTGAAKLIVVAPCCHQELRSQIVHPEPLAPVLRHGAMDERMGEWVTDGLRTLYLEWAGYRTKAIDFVASEHTPKNLMISAIRQGEPFQDAEARLRLEKFKTFFGIEQTHLEAESPVT